MGGCSGGEDSTDDSALPGSSGYLIQRAAGFELSTPYEAPPGDPLHHHTAGFAKILCSGVFITGLDPDDAAANVGGFTAPFDERGHVTDTAVDYENQSVSLTPWEDLPGIAVLDRNASTPDGRRGWRLAPTEAAERMQQPAEDDAATGGRELPNRGKIAT